MSNITPPPLCTCYFILSLSKNACGMCSKSDLYLQQWSKSELHSPTVRGAQEQRKKEKIVLTIREDMTCAQRMLEQKAVLDLRHSGLFYAIFDCQERHISLIMESNKCTKKFRAISWR